MKERKKEIHKITCAYILLDLYHMKLYIIIHEEHNTINCQ